MKTITIVLLSIFSCAVACAEEVYIFTDYTPVRLMYMTEGSDVEIEAGKAGMTGSRKKISKSDIPSDRSDRSAWKFKNNRIEVDAKLKKDRQDAELSKEAKKSKLVGRLKNLGLDDDDLSALGVKI